MEIQKKEHLVNVKTVGNLLFEDVSIRGTAGKKLSLNKFMSCFYKLNLGAEELFSLVVTWIRAKHDFHSEADAHWSLLHKLNLGTNWKCCKALRDGTPFEFFQKGNLFKNGDPRWFDNFKGTPMAGNIIYKYWWQPVENEKMKELENLIIYQEKEYFQMMDKLKTGYLSSETRCDNWFFSAERGGKELLYNLQVAVRKERENHRTNMKNYISQRWFIRGEECRIKYSSYISYAKARFYEDAVAIEPILPNHAIFVVGRKDWDQRHVIDLRKVEHLRFYHTTKNKSTIVGTFGVK